MTANRSGFGQRAARALPATVFALAAVTGLGGSVHLSQVGGPSAAQGAPQPPMPQAPVPGDAIQAPASLTATQSGRPGMEAQLQVISTSSAKQIPSAALSAYQRAAAVINASDPGCRLDWELVAAIGRVESDHGRHGGSILDADGVAEPAIIGVPLNGRGTARIDDTDAGQFDDDVRFDRAVGPMQFIPSTWSLVGVDADGDGQRNPQDIDDAALAAAVYLCSGADDLATDAGRRSAVYRYNHSQSYVAVVLGLMEKYVDGYFSALPTTSIVAASIDSRQVDRVAVRPGAVPRESTEVERVTRTRKPSTDDAETAAEGGEATTGIEVPPGETGGSTEPIEPTEPTVPTDPADPSEPTDPAGPTDPSEPTDPADPSEPAPGDEASCPASEGVIDPETGQLIDPETGHLIDPETGYPIDPETGEAYDPETGFPIDPETGLPTDPETGMPVEPDETTDPCVVEEATPPQG